MKDPVFEPGDSFLILEDAIALARAWHERDAVISAQQMISLVIGKLPPNEGRLLWENIGMLAKYDDVPMKAVRSY